MTEKRPTSRGGFFDFMMLINHEQEKQGKPVAIGFECDKEHKGHIRFFDKDNKTLWFDDKFYRDANKELIRMGALRLGRYESHYWKRIASGKYTFEEKVKMKVHEFTKGVKDFLGMGGR